MRPRLIYTFLAELYGLDTATTDAESGYDNVFGEPRVRSVDGVRVRARKELTPIRVRCQIEDDTWRNLRMTDDGNSPESKIAIVVDAHDMRRRGLIDAGGRVRLNVNDRLGAIYRKDGTVEHTIPDPPGLYAIEVRPISYGIGGTLNLYLVRFADRMQGRTGAGG